jgi:predicted DCC family thiol-disulfide oxidoreductase YuxK
MDTSRSAGGVTILLYDSDCGFCRWSVNKLMRWDRHGRVRAVALQDDEAANFLAGMSEDERMSSWHIVLDDGRIFSAGAAAPPLLRLLPGGGPLAFILGRFPGLTERTYRWVTRHRDELGRLVGERACAVDPRRDRSA